MMMVMMTTMMMTMTIITVILIKVILTYATSAPACWGSDLQKTDTCGCDHKHDDDGDDDDDDDDDDDNNSDSHQGYPDLRHVSSRMLGVRPPED
ncbi:hypothetical protein ACOMHN_005147 [Nucella lapillus]